MSKHTLGLPFEYQKFPEYFDACNTNPDTEAKNTVIEKLLGEQAVKTVLDLTCGTGSQVFFLAERGYQVTGADFSSQLLVMARERALKEHRAIAFIDGDMRTLQAGTFDAVITISNAIGHLTKAGFTQALKNVNNNLKQGGIYVFDILNLQTMTDTVVANLAWCVRKKVHETQIHLAQFSTIDRNRGRLTSYDTYSIQKNAEKPQNFHQRFSLQIYTAQELKELLSKNGFDVISQRQMDGSSFIEETSTTILTEQGKDNQLTFL